MGFSWAADADERDAWIAFAGGIEGLQVDCIRYFNIDYRRDEIAPEHVGVRAITGEDEWSAPTFEFPGGHTLDYGLELIGPGHDTWSVTWIPPGLTEGLALYHEPLLPDVLSEAGMTAIWDVSTCSAWQPLLGESIEHIHVDYEPWDDSGSWWCTRLELAFASATVELLEAEGRPDGVLVPSADNVVARFTLKR